MFRIGQKVVCVAPFNGERDWERTCPQVGQIYTIREIFFGYLRFEEIINAPRQYMGGFGEVAFNPAKFRSLEEEKGEMYIEDFITIENLS